MMEPKEFENALKQESDRLERLKTRYEMYFQGLERAEPSELRRRLERSIERLRKIQPHSTQLRFKFNTLLQRYLTLEAYWRRVIRQIEAGTYYRDVARVERRKDAGRRDPSR